MTGTPQHWIGTDAGGAREGNEDAFLWLGPDETGGNGYLWMVVDGEGGPGVGDLAAAMVTVTVGELYGELLDMHGDPVAALEFALREADSRLDTIAQVYPRLVGVRASYAALAFYEGRVHPVVAGTAAAFRVQHGTIERIGVSDVKKHQRSPDDLDPVPGTGVGIYGAVRQPVDDVDEPDDATWFLCTDGVTEMVPEELLAQGVERLSPKGAVEALVELARRRWGDDDASAALVRFGNPDMQINTSVDAFLDWADSGMTHWPDQTLMLQIGAAAHDGTPARSNVEGLPPIEGEAVADEADEESVVHTMTFSADQVRAIVQASGETEGAAGPGRATSGGTAAGAPEGPAVQAAAEPVAPTAEPAETSPSERSPSERSPSEPDPSVPTTEPSAAPAKPSAPATSAGGTFFFSPQQMAEVRAAADAAVAPPGPEEPTGSEKVPEAAATDEAPESSPPVAAGPATAGATEPSEQDGDGSTSKFGAARPGTEPITGTPIEAAAAVEEVAAVVVSRTADLADEDVESSVPRTAEFAGVRDHRVSDTGDPGTDDIETVQRSHLTNAELRAARSNVTLALVWLGLAAAAVGVGIWFALR